MKPKLAIILLCFVSISCKSDSYLLKYKSQIVQKPVKKNSKLTANDWKNWFHKDPITDTILGISTKLAQDFLKNKKSIPIVIAFIDSRLDTTHNDLQDVLWINKREIPNNKIDDDKNGYIDDIHGWNFLGNSKGEQVYRAKGEYTRIIRKYSDIFKNKDKIPNKLKDEYNQYLLALKEHERKLKIVKENIIYLDSVEDHKKDLKNRLAFLFPSNKKLSVEVLDSLLKINRNDSIELRQLKEIVAGSDWYKNRRIYEELKSSILLNVNFNEREIIGDNEDNIDDKFYGNNKIYIDTTSNRHSHAIKTVGTIYGNKFNDSTNKIIVNRNIKTMLLSVAPYGDTHDKDIALAIRYAVDNGAKVINMSIGRNFSLYEDWVYDAIKYAERKDVIIITSSGNDGLDLDKNFNYPNDAKNHGKEFVKNFIKVGSSEINMNAFMVSSFSNYGKNEVDIFAPGRYIYTSFNDNKHNYDSGTSLSCAIVSGVVALIRSYYPNLTAAEVKQIIMKSGVSFDIMVNKPSETKEKELVPFSSLSKSGKIVNAYHALLMAEEVSKHKKIN